MFPTSLPSQPAIRLTVLVPDGLPFRLVLRAPTVGRAEREPCDLGQQIATVPGDLSQLCRPEGFLGFGQAAPPGVPEGNAPAGER